MIVAAIAGAEHAGVVTSERSVCSWGLGDAVRLGRNDAKDQLVPNEEKVDADTHLGSLRYCSQMRPEHNQSWP